MNYFTRDLLERMQSRDDETLDAVDAEWESAIRRYRRRIAKIRGSLPASVRALMEGLSLHDADVLSLARENGHFVVVLRLEPPDHRTVILTYTLFGEPVIDEQALSRERRTTGVQWLYDEWDIAPRARSRYMHRILLSNGWELRLTFRAVKVVAAEGLLPPLAAAESFTTATVG